MKPVVPVAHLTVNWGALRPPSHPAHGVEQPGTAFSQPLNNHAAGSDGDLAGVGKGTEGHCSSALAYLNPSPKTCNTLSCIIT